MRRGLTGQYHVTQVAGEIIAGARNVSAGQAG
jgi:hypothetical protein